MFRRPVGFAPYLTIQDPDPYTSALEDFREVGLDSFNSGHQTHTGSGCAVTHYSRLVTNFFISLGYSGT